MLEGLKQKPEATRRKIALGTSIFISLLIFSGWFYTKGYLGYSTTNISQGEESLLVERQPLEAKSPVENTKSTFSSAFGSFGEEFQRLKDSLASVMVPFITGIDVYNKGDSE